MRRMASQGRKIFRPLRKPNNFMRRLWCKTGLHRIKSIVSPLTPALSPRGARECFLVVPFVGINVRQYRATPTCRFISTSLRANCYFHSGIDGFTFFVFSQLTARRTNSVAFLRPNFSLILSR